MQTIHTELKKYLYNKTRGLVSLRPEDSAAIVDIVKSKSAEAVFYKYNNVQNSYEKFRTIQTSDAVINKVAEDYKNKPPIKGFARWDLYNSIGELIAQIFVLNYDLI